MRKLVRYLKNYKLNLTLGPLAKLTEAIFELIVPLVMSDIIDNGIDGDGGIEYVLSHGAIMVALGVMGLACALTCQYLAAKCSQGFGTELRNDLFRHINTLSFKELDKFGTPSIVNRLSSDVNQLQYMVAMLIRLVIRAPFLVIGAAVMAMTINLKLSLVFIAAAPLIAVALYFIMSRSIPLYKNVQQKLDKVAQITRENLSGVRVVRAFSEQEYEKDRFDKSADELTRGAIVVGRISALLNPATFVIINAAIIAILWFGGGLVNTGEMTQGEVFAFVNYMTQISLALVVVAQLVVTVTKAIASGTRVVELLDATPSITDDGNTEVDTSVDSPAVKFDHVSFGYNEGKYTLTDLTLTVPRGASVGVIGGTGSGKSTLVNLLARFYDVSEGSVELFGTDVKKYPLKQLRRTVAYVPQNTMLFSGTIRSNLLMGGRDADDETLWKCLETAQAASFVREKEKGLDSVVMQGGKNFSGGQRQRLAVARALAANSDILVLDDSSSALDFATDLNMRTAINATRGDTTLFLVSQRATSLKDCDVIVVLDGGLVAGIGKHDDLLKTCDVYREIYLSQTDGGAKQ
ncbi:MAG TPA: ABC transporter ATP-binding protein [Candidatus Ornithoclostridium faecigallinarum]|nr:ABC transporter ATP-binding protein [Candidatus Ornithoclostridium faecigallinarum]